MSSEIKSHDAGFMLLEVLAAIFIALLFVSVLTTGFQTAWSRSRHPAEAIWAMSLARKVAGDLRLGLPTDNVEDSGFSYDFDVEPITLNDLQSNLPTAPRSFLDMGNNLTQQKPVSPGQLKLVTVRVTDPSRRIYVYESIQLNFGQNTK